MAQSKQIYYIKDTQDDLNSYWIDEQGTKVTKREVLIEKWNKVVDKAHIKTQRKRVLMG